jgi:hypothetical protein
MIKARSGRHKGEIDPKRETMASQEQIQAARNIHGRSKMGKWELIDALRQR